METKKSPKADLEKRRSLFILIGFVLVFALLYIGLEWSSERKRIEVVFDPFDGVEVDWIIPTTPPDQPQEVTPPPPLAQVINEVINIVGNEIETTPTSIIPVENPDAPIVIPQPPLPPPPPEPIEPIFNPSELSDPPSFPGGPDAMNKFIYSTVRYPPLAIELNLSGTVWVAFVVNKDGKIVDIQIARSVHSILDNEAIRVVKAMPAWNPGMQRGQPVRTRFTLPVRFTLQ